MSYTKRYLEWALDKLDKALIYVDRIADGKNPINNMPADNDDVMNDPNVIRCMFFIKDVLLALKENGGVIGKTSGIKKKEFPMESLSEYQFIETKTITRFTEQLNSGIDEKEYKRMSETKNPYGDGHASERIVDAIIEKLLSVKG